MPSALVKPPVDPGGNTHFRGPIFSGGRLAKGLAPLFKKVYIDASKGTDFSQLDPVPPGAILLSTGVAVVGAFSGGTGAKFSVGLTQNGVEIAALTAIPATGTVTAASLRGASPTGAVYFTYQANGATAGQAVILLEYLWPNWIGDDLG